MRTTKPIAIETLVTLLDESTQSASTDLGMSLVSVCQHPTYGEISLISCASAANGAGAIIIESQFADCVA